MLDGSQLQNKPKSFVKTIYVWFLRVMSVLCLISALMYWSQLIGLSGQGAFRFDLLEQHWRFLSTVLAIVLPSAALGLWMTQTWGVLLWAICLVIEILAFSYWSNLFVAKPTLVVGHLAALGFLLILAALLYFERRRQNLVGF